MTSISVPGERLAAYAEADEDHQLLGDCPDGIRGAQDCTLHVQSQFELKGQNSATRLSKLTSGVRELEQTHLQHVPASVADETE